MKIKQAITLMLLIFFGGVNASPIKSGMADFG
jgi:hypothetical protein